MQLVRDPEFEAFLPRCSHERNAALEEELVARGGPRDTIKVWQGSGIIVDGYRRHEICERLGLPYHIEELPFSTRTEVLRWMFNQQDMRRNMTPHERAMLLVTLKELINRETGGQLSRVKLTEAVAEQANASPRSVYRAESYDRAFKRLIPAWQQLIESGELRPAHVDVRELARLSPEQQAEVMRQWKSGEFSSYKAAVWGEGNDGPDLDDYDPPVPDDSQDETRSAKAERKVFKNIWAGMARLRALIEQAGDLRKGGPLYQLTKDALDKVGDAIQQWQDAK
jgi:hypothetical protein